MVDSERGERIAEGTRRYRNRNEREFAGYRDATDMLMGLGAYEPLSVPFILHLHRLLFDHTRGNGGHLKSDQNLIVSYESGRKDVIFTPPAPEETSIEQRVYESKNSYYASLYESQRRWHGGDHDVWPWISYLCRILAGAYDDFERRVAATSEETGSKQERARDYVLHKAPATFRRRDVERALPGISQATIRLVLGELRDEGKVETEGSGRGARWRRL